MKKICLILIFLGLFSCASKNDKCIYKINTDSIRSSTFYVDYLSVGLFGDDTIILVEPELEMWPSGALYPLNDYITQLLKFDFNKKVEKKFLKSFSGDTLNSFRAFKKHYVAPHVKETNSFLWFGGAFLPKNQQSEDFKAQKLVANLASLPVKLLEDEILIALTTQDLNEDGKPDYLGIYANKYTPQQLSFFIQESGFWGYKTVFHKSTNLLMMELLAPYGNNTLDVALKTKKIGKNWRIFLFVGKGMRKYFMVVDRIAL